MANKDIKQAEAAKIKNIIMKNTERYVDYDEECPFESRRVAEPDELAEKLYNAGYHKTIWHKVAEGTWKVIPRDMMLLFVIQYEDINTGEIIKQVIPGSIDGESNCLHLHCASSKDTPNNRNTEDVIAWTELPTYKE